MTSDWELLLHFFPRNWRRLGVQSGAISRNLKGFSSEDTLLRTLLIHLACGYSLRETAVRAQESQLSNVSDVALLKRLRGCKNWFHEMCLSLMDEQGISLPCSGVKCRLIDATVVKEPGPTGSTWRVHYSLSVPGFTCDYLEVTPTKGANSGESLKHFPIKEGDFIIADAGYLTPKGVGHVDSHKGYLLVRVNPVALPFYKKQGQKTLRFDLLKGCKKIKKANSAMSYDVLVIDGDRTIRGRLCVLKKNDLAIKLAQKKAKRKAQDNRRIIRKQTLEYAKYVIVFTTFPKHEFTCREVLRWYRLRWQIELIFKRFKSLAGLGCLPKYDDESSKAWLYGKLFIILLIQKVIVHAQLLQPCHQKNLRLPSHWREFSFMLHQIQQTIEPHVQLQKVIKFWNDISKELSEAPRKRKPQLAKYNFLKYVLK